MSRQGDGLTKEQAHGFIPPESPTPLPRILARPDGLTPDSAQNRRFWDEVSDEYQADHGEFLAKRGGMAWGIWQIPESDVRMQGDVEGRDVLELGCGAAQWSIALAQRGARPVGLDLSERQLQHAKRLMTQAGVSFPLVHASAESVPLPDSSFDLVFCDWGALAFADPESTLPEAWRLLRPGGALVFNGGTPFYECCWVSNHEHAHDRLLRDYFGMYRVDDAETVEFVPTYGEWVRLFRRHGFLIEDLVELRPPEDATSPFRDEVDQAWSRRWPMEQIWKVRRPAES